VKVADLKKALRGVKDDAELTISVDVSTGQEDWEKRCFADELIELQENSLDGLDVSLLTTGRVENAQEITALRNVLALSNRLWKTDPACAAHLVRFCASAGVVPYVMRKRPSARYKPKAPPDVAVRVLSEAPNCIGVLTHPPNDLCPKCDR